MKIKSVASAHAERKIMVRVALLFWVAAALAVLVLSNLSPVVLTILGTKTLALPLGVWVAGAIGAGAITTVILAGLFNLTRPVAAPVSARRPSPRSADRFSPNSFRPPWSAGATASGATASSAGYTNARTAEQRQTSQQSNQQSRAAWEDWDDQPDLADRKPTTPASIRDTEDDDWANWEGYDDRERQRSRRRDQEDDLDDNLNDFADDRQDRGFYDESSARTDFEVKREPETRSQSGSVYSFSYRRSEDDPPQPAKPTAKPGEVYDADYRVITPPYRPDPEEVIRPPDRTDRTTEIRDSGFDADKFADKLEDRRDNNNENDDDDDWGLDDDLEERGDRPRS